MQNKNIQLFKLVESLLNNGANINYKDKLENTCLHNFVSHKKKEIIELLLNHGADIHNKKYKWRYSTS